MKRIEIDRSMSVFYNLSLPAILLRLKNFAILYVWSIQLIEGVGDIESVIGMTIVDLENFCENSEQGYVTDFETILEISKACEDIVDIVIVGCESQEKIPKAYQTPNWEKNCSVIISREGSSLWQLSLTNEDILRIFTDLAA